VPRLPSKSTSDSGSALLEFVLFFTLGLALVLAASAGFESNLRSRSAAMAIANEALRTLQLTADSRLAAQAAASAAEVFELPQGAWSISIPNSCGAFENVRVLARVREVTEHAQGSC
jgi:hypothetical protein